MSRDPVTGRFTHGASEEPPPRSKKSKDRVWVDTTVEQRLEVIRKNDLLRLGEEMLQEQAHSGFLDPREKNLPHVKARESSSQNSPQKKGEDDQT